MEAAGDLWIERSARTWTLDLDMLTGAGITIYRPDAPEQRAATADRELRAARGY